MRPLCTSQLRCPLRVHRRGRTSGPQRFAIHIVPRRSADSRGGEGDHDACLPCTWPGGLRGHVVRDLFCVTCMWKSRASPRSESQVSSRVPLSMRSHSVTPRESLDSDNSIRLACGPRLLLSVHAEPLRDSSLPPSHSLPRSPLSRYTCVRAPPEPGHLKLKCAHRLLAFMSATTPGRSDARVPAAKLVRGDGDHAVAHSVPRFMLEIPAAEQEGDAGSIGGGSRG